ncbi:MAG TPA: M56 family metallopeptidase [Flavisolibacter sp.]|nr:M56 family metallopeptidase [Flavisolibacter sp.]
MAAWMQSHFLQALGWATLNSLWQMALLWALFCSINHTCRLSASRKYQASVGAILLGFTWFLSTFLFYYQNHSSSYAFFENTVVHSNILLHICLLSASVTYLLLLVFPAIRLFRNWQFVQRIKTEGQSKAQLEYRLFVQKVGFLLGVTKKVKLAVSSMVSSPVTVGYLKPIILLPVAAMNQLTPAQVEAILLHELSHIRRYDYLLNFIVSVIHTVLYFNPFVKVFMNTIEAEREACCDEVVLQFGYDKVSYASALLHLEKNSGRHHSLALAAAGKQNLLTRIEKIVGMEKKKTFKLVQIVPLFLAMFCILLFNSVLIIKDAKSGESMTYSDNTVFSPWQLNNSRHKLSMPDASQSKEPFMAKATNKELPATGQVKIEIINVNEQPQAAEPAMPSTDHIIPVDFDEVDGSLTKEQKQNVKSTIEATRKVAGTLQWKEIENNIGDAMDTKEKAIARQEYLRELDKVSWNNIEQNMKANYDKVNWEAVQQELNQAMVQVQMDSVQNVYAQALAEVQKLEASLKSKAKCAANPLPDASVEELKLAKLTLQRNLDSLKVAVTPKKVIRM